MSSPPDSGKGSGSIRLAVIAAALAVAACFGVAVSLAGTSAAAEQAVMAD